MKRCDSAEPSNVASGRNRIGDNDTKQMKARVHQAVSAKNLLIIFLPTPGTAMERHFGCVWRIQYFHD